MQLNNHEFLTAFIDNSPTRRETLGANIANAPHKAVMYDTDGNIVLATDAAKAVGILLSDTHQSNIDGTLTAKKGEEATIIVKNIGLLEAGAAIAKGDWITINANGQGEPATAGKFIFGRAFTAAAAAGELVQVMICPAGAAPAAQVTTKKED